MYTGLTNEEVIENKKKYGTNEITNKKNNSFFKLFIETLADPIIKILLIALAIKTIFLFQDFDWFETIGIVIAIIVASLISAISEYGSESAFERLQESSSKINFKVKRNNKITETSIDDIVVNDIVLLQSGDRIPADGIIVSGEIDVDESSLTGETIEITKNSTGTNNTVYRGTVVYSKEALMKVEKVGNDTFYGKMSQELQEDSQDSPLKLRLRKLAGTISVIGYISAALVSISYLFSQVVVENNFVVSEMIKTLTNFPLMFKHILYALTLSVTIIVVAVPEGLPMMITLVLSSNMKKLLKNNVLVRKLVGIETAGSLNILFTDKTGTLTKGQLEVASILTGDKKSYLSADELKPYKVYDEHLKYACVYNNSSYHDENNIAVGGNITDRAILNFIKEKPRTVKKIKSIPFDSTKKHSTVTIDIGRPVNYIKGAPEKLLPLCTNYISITGKKKSLITKDFIMSDIKSKTRNGLRAILLAYNDNYHYEELNRLTLIAVLYLKDEVRKEAIEGIELVKKAGIQTVMITGESKETAVSIAKETNLITNDKDIAITSNDLANLSDEEVKKILPNLRVVARSLPKDKSRLVRLAGELGLVTGMTGDGVNDAPAIKKADVGFAMGSGSEVCKEASDIVILDDNFLSITKAILFGRTIFKSIRKFIIFQLTINLCAVSLSIIGPFIGVETPVTIVQMLWINMIMDTLAGIAFSYEPALKSYMYEQPKKKEETIINKYMYGEILFTGIYSSLLCIFFLTNDTIKSLYRYDSSNKYFMTAFFALFIFMGIFNSFNARTTRINILSNLSKNKAFLIVTLIIVIVQLYLIYYGGELFRAFGLTLKEIQITILLAATVIPIDWIRKLITKRSHSSI